MIDIEKIRKDFKILEQIVHNKPLVYFDNAATTQKPKSVIDKTVDYYNNYNSNIHRAGHHLANLATQEYEKSRTYIKEFLNAASTDEILFTSGTTAGLNLIAFSFTERYIKSGDNVIISEMEHHANIVPWQLACERKGANLRVIPITDSGELKIDELVKLIDGRTKIISIAYISNVLGTINDVRKVIEIAHQMDIPVVLDAAQAVAHLEIDVQELDCDFLVFSGHKIYGPTGTGILYGKAKYLNEMPPYQSGGEMIKQVSFEKTTFNELPYKFEPGTPNICGAIALSEGMRYIKEIGIPAIAEYENELLRYAEEKILQIEGVKIIGTAPEKAGALSFSVQGIHHYDIGVLLDQMGVAIRTGHHCAQPLMKRLGMEGTARASFALYNTKSEIDYFIGSLQRAVKLLK
ncbi:MAG: cysteine desulfurase [bacterium]